MNAPDHPGEQSRSFAHGQGRFTVKDQGVFYIGKDNDGQDKTPLFICARLDVTSKTRSEKNDEWGRLLEWSDDDGIVHQWVLPLSLMEGDGTELRRMLADQGLHIAQNPAARALLLAYIKEFPVDQRARGVRRLGWHGDVYVTPNATIGQSEERIVLQNRQAVEPNMGISGTVDEWQQHVAQRAQGNSRLVFALSTAFAGPLVEIAAMDSGGFHFRGPSSCGKSTALRLAASVFGQPSKYVRPWRSTTNGLEGLASIHNDGCLILDEIGQADPDKIGEAAYLLANGQGKARASRDGLARPADSWRLLFLSSGEHSLAMLMEQSGKRSTTGQEIRLADIDADAGAGMGLIEELHEYATSQGLIRELEDAYGRFYGAVGVRWIANLVEHRQALKNTIPGLIKAFVVDVVPEGSTGQVERVAKRFALVAVAGELATSFGLTGWSKGGAIAAAKTCFQSWFDGFGGKGNREERDILAHVRRFLEKHGSSRFEAMNAVAEQRIPNRVGFFREGDDGQREYLIPRQSFTSELCAGFDAKLVIHVLKKQGMLIPGTDGKPTTVVRLPGFGQSNRVYVLRHSSGAQ